MNEFSYFNIRAQHHSRLAPEASDPRLKAAHEAIAAHMSARWRRPIRIVKLSWSMA
jgi:hypothetical protein